MNPFFLGMPTTEKEYPGLEKLTYWKLQNVTSHCRLLVIYKVQKENQKQLKDGKKVAEKEEKNARNKV